jgi:hypothetical protein
MGRSLPTMFLATIMVLGCAGAASRLRDEMPSPQFGKPTPACALLSIDEIRKATGRQDYPPGSNGDQLGEGVGGGSSCQYGGDTFSPGDHPPMLSLVLIPGKRYTETRRAGKLRPGCSIEAVSGLGDEAFFESCADPKPIRSAPLFVKVGANDLIFQLDVKPPATPASLKPTLIAVARAAVGKLR